MHVRVHGRLLAESARPTTGIGSTSNEDPGAWVAVCPNCDRSLLAQTGIPFALADGTMRTLRDYDPTTGQFDPIPAFSFANLRFSLSCLTYVKRHNVLTGSTTAQVEQKGRALPELPTPAQARAFSEKVCTWGGGQRVWANLKRHNSTRLGQNLADWFVSARQAESPADAIAPGVKIKGLGVSFASKHLRMLDPSRFATLDSVIHGGFGYAMNLPGYSLFMRDLRQLRESLPAEAQGMSLADCEVGLFLLIRPHVRSKTDNEA